MYTNQADVRDLIGVTIDEAPDDIIKEFIEKAQKIVQKHIQVPIMNEVLIGNIDGTSTTFRVKDAPFIADRNFDLVVNTFDIEIYQWEDSTDESTKSSLSVLAFYPETGLIILSSVPSSTADQVTINYSYYTCKIDWDLVTLATGYYAAMMWVGREMYLVPERVFLGELRTVRSKGEPWETLRREYMRIINLLIAAPMEKVAYRRMVVDPRGPYNDENTGLIDGFQRTT